MREKNAGADAPDPRRPAEAVLMKREDCENTKPLTKKWGLL